MLILLGAEYQLIFERTTIHCNKY